MDNNQLPNIDEVEHTDADEDAKQRFSAMQAATLPENGDGIVEEWLRKMDEGTLTSQDFINYWRVTVPRVYSTKFNRCCPGGSFDNERITTLLLNTLEKFICGGEDFDDALQKFKKLNENEPSTSASPSTSHGRDTNSPRRNRSRTRPDGGSNICNCGNSGVWRRNPHCSRHGPFRVNWSLHFEYVSSLEYLSSMHRDAFFSMLKSLNCLIDKSDEMIDRISSSHISEDMIARAKMVFSVLLNYCLLFTTSFESPRSLPLDYVYKDDEKCPLEDTENYCVMFYNKQLSMAYQDARLCMTMSPERGANEIAEQLTIINSEGRIVVKCSTLENCHNFQGCFYTFLQEHHDKFDHLRMNILHSFHVNHQLFAMRLLRWTQSILKYSEKLRKSFGLVAIGDSKDSITVLETVMLRDGFFWKTARSAWHRLIISAIITNYDFKKQLALKLLKHYDPILNSFLDHGHEHPFSIASLTQQLFSSAAITDHLMKHANAPSILLNTYVNECSRWCNNEGKLDCKHKSFKMDRLIRAQCILHDVKSLLNNRLFKWTKLLRKNFLDLISVLLKLFSMMQHMEPTSKILRWAYDNDLRMMVEQNRPEYPLYLHETMTSLVSIILEWCGTDQMVLGNAYKMTLTALAKCPPNKVKKNRTLELAGHTTKCVAFEVDNGPVSTHLPLTRFLAGLHSKLNRYDMTFKMVDYRMSRLSWVHIIEPILRTRALISFINAGIWRSPPLQLENQIRYYLYHKCRLESSDRDLLLLQVSACYMDGNDFILHLLNKFDLAPWTSDEYLDDIDRSSSEEFIEVFIYLIEELLGLILNVICSRHVPCISSCTKRDELKKEIIQSLCGGPMKNSALLALLPTYYFNEIKVQHVIDEVAEFTFPDGASNRGVHSLRPEFYSEYNVFYHHYDRDKITHCRQVQTNRRKRLGGLDCCPPPDLPQLTHEFFEMNRLLQCKIMLHIIKTILTRCSNPKTNSSSEMQLHKVLYLIGIALQEEESGRYPYFEFIRKAVRYGIFKLLCKLKWCGRFEIHRDLLTWTIEKYKLVAVLRGIPFHDERVNVEVIPDIPDAEEQARRERLKKLAKASRDATMARMKSQQDSFWNKVKHSKEIEDINMDVPAENIYTCVLCRESISIDKKIMVLPTFIQISTVLSTDTTIPPPSSKDEQPICLGSSLGYSPYISSCGHYMHFTCWLDSFQKAILDKQDQIYRHWIRMGSYMVDEEEFFCPLCKTVANSLLPVGVSLKSLQPKINPVPDIHFKDWYTKLKILFSKMDSEEDTNNFEQFESISSLGKTFPSIDINSHNLIKLPPKLHDRMEQSTIPESVDSLPNPLPSVEINSTELNEEKDESISDDKELSSQSNEPNAYSSRDDLNSCSTEEYSENTIMLASEDGDEQNARAMQISESESFSTQPINNEIIPDQVVEVNISNDTDPDVINAINDPNTFIKLFVMALQTRGSEYSEHSQGHRFLPLTWNGLAYTLQAIDSVTQNSGQPLLSLSSRHHNCLQALIRFAGILGKSIMPTYVINMYAVRLLKPLLDFENSHNICILDWDPVGYLVALTMCHSGIFQNDESILPIPLDGMMNQHLYKLVLIKNIIKIIVTGDFSKCTHKDEYKGASSIDNLSKLLNILKNIRTDIDVENLNKNLVWNVIKNECNTFLRSSCRLYHYLFEKSASTELSESGGDTFENMCQFIGVPWTFDEIFKSSVEIDIAMQWSQHPKVVSYLSRMPLVSLPKKPIGLIKLPHDFDELLVMASTFKCPIHENEGSKHPTMCLICGKLLCSESHCYRENNAYEYAVGPCTNHTRCCGSTIGVFLRIQECDILFLARPYKGTFAYAPYLDRFGEYDYGLFRGNPLYICEFGYSKIQKLWLNHEIPNEIAKSVVVASCFVPTPLNMQIMYQFL